MTTIGPTTSAMSLATSLPPSDAAGALRGLSSASTQSQDKLRQAFSDFVGETFFGQMIKAMRSTVGKPAYFYGGQGEEVFRGQLDQIFAEQMTKASAEQFAEPMFERQFPDLSQSQPKPNTQPGLDQLSQLSRR
jgi:flagellar protein FlgJ